jgi:hypothetical protein
LQTKFESEILALLFGVLVILLNFGDDHIGPTVGNLDTIFGLRLWPLMDVIYPVTSIIIFLAYGATKSKGYLKFNAKTAVPIAVYLLALFLISVDDVSQVLNLGLTFPETYWIAIMWLYPLISFVAFFSFGLENQRVRA